VQHIHLYELLAVVVDRWSELM